MANNPMNRPERPKKGIKQIQNIGKPRSEHKLMFLIGFEGPEGLEKMRETCSLHPALKACLNSSMVFSYGQKK